MNATVKPLPSVKLATAAVKCEMAAEKSYLVWHQMMRDLVDKDIKRQREVDQERQVFELAKTMLAKKSQELANAETEIKRLKRKVKTTEAHLLLCQQGSSQDALDSLKEYSQGRLLAEKYEKVLRQIADEDISSTKAFFASAKMKQWAKEVLGDE